MENVNTLLEKFYIERTRGLSIQGRSNYIKALQSLIRTTKKPLQKITKNDIITWIKVLDQQQYKNATKNLYKICIKNFYSWLYGCEEKEYPPVIKWLKTTRANNEMRNKLISKADIQKLITSLDHPRDKALIAVLYESAGRISEILNLKIKHVGFDKYGAIIRVFGTTGERPIRIINSVAYLQSWINVHPHRKDSEALIFTRNRGSNIQEPLNIRYINNFLKRKTTKLGIGHIHPHMFRHTRLTELAPLLKEVELRIFAGWTSNSDMPAIYVHLSARDIDEAVLRAEGVKTEENKAATEKVLQVKECSRCGTTNPMDSKFCYKCSMALDLETAMELQIEYNQYKKVLEAFNNPDFQKFIESFGKQSGKYLYTKDQI